jgi:hypothetical protein
MKTFKANFCEDYLGFLTQREMTYDEILCCLCKKSEEIKHTDPFDGVIKFFNLIINWKDSKIDADIVEKSKWYHDSIEPIPITDNFSAEINSLQQLSAFFQKEFADTTEGCVVLKVVPGVRPVTGDHIEWCPDPSLRKYGARDYSVKYYKEHISNHPEVFDFISLWIKEKIEELQIILEEADRCHEHVSL